MEKRNFEPFCDEALNYAAKLLRYRAYTGMNRQAKKRVCERILQAWKAFYEAEMPELREGDAGQSVRRLPLPELDSEICIVTITNPADEWQAIPTDVYGIISGQRYELHQFITELYDCIQFYYED